MAYTKKKWVNVPDPSNLPSIPEGQDALACFDAENMNRIEDGIVEIQALADSKAPGGHGLGETGYGSVAPTFQEFMRKGCGFYQAGNKTDSPLGTSEWTSLLQISRGTTAGKETGAQLAFYDFDKYKPRMWMRTLITGNPSNWVEVLHTKNAVDELSNLGMAKFKSGVHLGIGGWGKSNPTTIPVPFKPKLMLIGEGGKKTMDIYNEDWFTSEYAYTDVNEQHIKYESGTIYIYGHDTTSGEKYQYNVSGKTYRWYIFG